MNSTEIRAELQKLREALHDDAKVDLSQSGVLFLGEIAHQLAVSNETSVVLPSEVSKADLHAKLDSLFESLRQRLLLVEKRAATVDELKQVVGDAAPALAKLKALVG